MDEKMVLTRLISDETGLAENEINGDESFENFNMDSLSMVSLAFELENASGLVNIDPTVFNEYNTVNKLAGWISTQKK